MGYAALVAIAALAALGVYLALHGGGTAAVSTHPSPSPAASAHHRPQSVALPAGHPVSVSFPSEAHGWMLLGKRCESKGCAGGEVLETKDFGRSWKSLGPAPSLRPSRPILSLALPVGGSVNQIYFANARDGWLFGGDLYATHDGGRSWSRVSTEVRNRSLVVRDVVSAGRRLYVFGAECNAEGGECQDGSLLTGPIAGGKLKPVPSLVRFGLPGGLYSADSLSAAGHGVYALIRPHVHSSPKRELIAASPDGRSWSFEALPRGCATSSRTLGAWSSSGLVLACAGIPGAGEQMQHFFVSTDGARHWRSVTTAVLGGYATSIAAVSRGTWYLAGERSPVQETTDGGAHWTGAVGANPYDSGFTSVETVGSRHAVALPANWRARSAWFTSTGTRGWYREGFSRPSRHARDASN